METQEKDYTMMSILAGYCGLVPYIDRWGNIKDGVYAMAGLNAPVDLSACAEDEKSILKTAVKQLSEQIEESYQNAIERDLMD